VVNNHLVTARVEEYPAALQKYADDLRGRSMLVTKAQMIDIECVRAAIFPDRLEGVQQSGAVCGIKLPAGSRSQTNCPNRSLPRPPRRSAAMMKTSLLKRWPSGREKSWQRSCAI